MSATAVEVTRSLWEIFALFNEETSVGKRIPNNISSYGAKRGGQDGARKD